MKTNLAHTYTMHRSFYYSANRADGQPYSGHLIAMSDDMTNQIRIFNEAVSDSFFSITTYERLMKER